MTKNTTKVTETPTPKTHMLDVFKDLVKLDTRGLHLVSVSASDIRGAKSIFKNVQNSLMGLEELRKDHVFGATELLKAIQRLLAGYGDYFPVFVTRDGKWIRLAPVGNDIDYALYDKCPDPKNAVVFGLADHRVRLLQPKHKVTLFNSSSTVWDYVETSTRVPTNWSEPVPKEKANMNTILQQAVVALLQQEYHPEGVYDVYYRHSDYDKEIDGRRISSAYRLSTRRVCRVDSFLENIPTNTQVALIEDIPDEKIQKNEEPTEMHDDLEKRKGTDRSKLYPSELTHIERKSLMDRMMDLKEKLPLDHVDPSGRPRTTYRVVTLDNVRTLMNEAMADVYTALEIENPEARKRMVEMSFELMLSEMELDHSFEAEVPNDNNQKGEIPDTRRG